MENIAYTTETPLCNLCQSNKTSPFIRSCDDYTGKPGSFTFVRCQNCQLVYQSPRIIVDEIVQFYDDEYISHRKQKSWGLFKPFFDYAMSKHDRDKIALVSHYVDLKKSDHVLDVGCAVGSFLIALKKRLGCAIAGVDFKDLSHHRGFAAITFYKGLFYQQDVGHKRYRLITMWHFLEHCYDPMRSLQHARESLCDDGVLVIEVPCLDSVTFKIFGKQWPGLQAPQHTVLFERESLIKMVQKAGFSVDEHLRYGAFPPYMYVFMGIAFKILHGRGLKIRKAIMPYFIGQILTAPLLFWWRKQNLAMQTIVCRKKTLSPHQGTQNHESMATLP